jgi:hypothetical protein
MNRDLALKVVLWAIALYHVVLGGGAFLSADLAQQMAHSIFGIQLTLDPAMAFVVKVLGAYAITFGVVAAVAARDPVHHRLLLNVIVLLYVLRIVVKVVFKTEYETGLHIATTRVWVETALLSGFALAVYLLRPRPAAARV